MDKKSIKIKAVDREAGKYEIWHDGEKVGRIDWRNVPGEPGHYVARFPGRPDPILHDSLPKLRVAIAREII